MSPVNRTARRHSPAALATALALLVGAGLATAGPAPQESQARVDTARQLLQRAVHLEEAMGDPEAAIAAYESVLSAKDADAPLAAAAEFRLAVLLSRLGRTEEAREHHRRITEIYALDSRLEEIVRLARAALGEEVRRGAGTSMIARRLWAGSQSFAYGSLAPDASFLSFVDFASDNWNLGLHDLDRGTQRFLTDAETGEDRQTWCSSSVVSPNGRHIAYAWHTPTAGHSIKIIGRDGSGDRTVLELGNDANHVALTGWSRDGARLLAIVYAPAGNRIVMISTVDGELRTVRELGPRAPEKASLSPDGGWIAYHHLADDALTHNVMLTSTDGSTTTTLIDHPANDLLPIWTPDGRHVLFVSDRTGTLGAWMVEVVNGERRGEARVVRPDFGRAIPMGFTERDAFVYAMQLSTSDIYTAQLDLEKGRIGERIVSSGRFVGVNSLPVFSADGRNLAYLSERGSLPAGFGPSALVLRDLESDYERVLTPPLRKITELRWHPESDAVLALGIDQQQRQAIFRVDVKSGTTEPFVSWDEAGCQCVPSQAISPDGRRLAYFRPRSSDESGDLVVRNLADESEHVLVAQLYASAVGPLEFSPDSKTLAAAVRRRGSDGWRIHFLRLRSDGPGPSVPVGADAEPLAIVGWMPDGNGLLFVRAKADLHSLVWADHAGAVAETIVSDLPRHWRDLRLHPNGSTLVYTSGEYRSEIWMLENLLRVSNNDDDPDPDADPE